MAKKGIKLGFTAYSRRDPVSGNTKTFLRNSTTLSSSKKLLDFRSCVAGALRGKKASGSNPRDRAMSIRTTFASAAKSCAK